MEGIIDCTTVGAVAQYLLQVLTLSVVLGIALQISHRRNGGAS